MRTSIKVSRVAANLLVSIALLAIGSEAISANECDAFMKGLIDKNGGCRGGNCTYDVVGGQLVGANGGKVIKDQTYTEMKGLTSATAVSNGVSFVRIETGKPGQRRLILSVVDDKGRTTKSEYGFSEKDNDCVHELTERKGPLDVALGVEYDREFCATASQAYEGLDEAQAKTCDDLLKNLVGKYEERRNALAKDRKVFRSSTIEEAINAKTLANNGVNRTGQDTLIRALKQKDSCAKATTEMAYAGPLSTKQFMDRLSFLERDVVMDKRLSPPKFRRADERKRFRSEDTKH